MSARKISAAILVGLGASAAAAYLSDPKQGKKRREAVIRGTRKFLDNVTKDGEKALRDTQHRITGLAAHLRPGSRRENPCNEVVEARVRSRMGKVTHHAHKVHVIYDGGTITLWGAVPQGDLVAVIKSAETTPGVTSVINHLETFPSAEKAETHPLKEAREKLRLNWSPAKRLLVATSGAFMTLYGWRRKDMPGKALSLLGAGLTVRSMMQSHFLAGLALRKSSPGFELEKTIRIKAPISDLYNFWIQPENYPKVFTHVDRIDRLGENLYSWTINGPGGIPVKWEGVITRTVPNTLVEFKSLPGSVIANFGVIHFDAHYDASTRIHVRMFYRPPAGILGKFFAELLGANADKILDHDLKRLKYMFEKTDMASQQKSSLREEESLLKSATT